MTMALNEKRERRNQDVSGPTSLVEPMNLHDVFCGGQTNAVKLYHHGEEGEEIDLPLQILEQELRISLKTSCDNFSARSH